IVEPLTELDLVTAVAKLIAKLKGGTDLDSRLEFLIAYRDAPANSLKKQAYTAVNNYQTQVEQLIKRLQTQKNKRKSSLQELVSAKSEAELNQAYQLIQQDPQLTSPSPTPSASQLAQLLRTIVGSDSPKNDLVNLSTKIKLYSTASDPEKSTLYQQYGAVIDQLDQEIQAELTRRQEAEEEQRDTPTSPSTPPPSSGM
ncbi:12053_t:CDS:2, partial [Funneliformis geosporum]